MKILFITSTRIGDAVLSTGVLRALLGKWPESRITIVCGPLARSLFEGVPGLEKIIVLEKKRWKGHWVDLWRKTVHTRWDLVVDLRNSAVSRLIPRRKTRIFVSAHKSGHKVAQNAAVLGKEPPEDPVLWLTETQCRDAERIVPEGGPVLAIGPTANWSGKEWPQDRFIDLIARLTGPFGCLPEARVAVFAAPGEEGPARRVLESVPENRRIDVIARVDPGTAAAVLSKCTLYIGNDSGLMHCAAAVGIPTLGLFGPGLPEVYGPWGAHTDYVRAPGSPMEGLSVETVEEAASALLLQECFQIRRKEA